VTGFLLHSVPVHSGEHSGANSGMGLFRRNNLSPEWQFGWALCQILFRRNPPESAGMTGIRQESVGHDKDLLFKHDLLFLLTIKDILRTKATPPHLPYIVPKNI